MQDNERAQEFLKSTGDMSDGGWYHNYVGGDFELANLSTVVAETVMWAANQGGIWTLKFIHRHSNCKYPVSINAIISSQMGVDQTPCSQWPD